MPKYSKNTIVVDEPSLWTVNGVMDILYAGGTEHKSGKFTVLVGNIESYNSTDIDPTPYPDPTPDPTPDPDPDPQPDPEEGYWKTGLPVVIINTNGGIIQAPDGEWLPDVSIQIKETYNSQPSYESTALSIRGRGNSTWNESDKKPYALKLDTKSEILGMPAHKRWCLLANYFDRSLMRNDIAFKLGNAAGLDWTPSGRFVELVLNGVHRGNYYLCEQIRVSKNRVNISDTDDFLLEIDSYYDEQYKFTTQILSNTGYPYNIKSPDLDDASEMNQKLTFITAKMTSFELMLSGTDYSSWDSHIDYDQFAYYWFVTEVAGLIELRQTSNNDVGPHSLYLQYITSEDKLKIGPIWDFDLFAFQRGCPAAVSYNIQGLPATREGTIEEQIQAFYMLDKIIVKDTPFFAALFRNPTFVQRVKALWPTVKTAFLNVINTQVDSNYTLLNKSDVLNKALWDTGNESPYHTSGHQPDGGMSFSEAAQNIKDCCRTRITFVDGIVNQL